MRITSKGQVTIPQEIREKFGLLPNTEVVFVETRNGVRIVKSEKTGRTKRAEALVGRLRGRATVKMSTDEILSLTRK
jgi:AbrB family looped-hinge helix DNA binding protein